MPGKRVDRRQFLKSIAASGTVATWPAVASATLADSSPPKTYRVFTPSQATLMEAVVDQLIPPDDFPGGQGSGHGSLHRSKARGTLRQVLHRPL